jgi:hypothetical protein
MGVCAGRSLGSRGVASSEASIVTMSEPTNRADPARSRSATSGPRRFRLNVVTRQLVAAARPVVPQAVRSRLTKAPGFATTAGQALRSSSNICLGTRFSARL